MKLLDRSLLVDPSSKGLANVVVFARKTSRVKNAPSPTEPLVFDQKNCEFLSPVFAARVGQPIDVKNSDPIGHNTNIAGTSFNQLIPGGQGTRLQARFRDGHADDGHLQHPSVDEGLRASSARTATSP